MNERVNQAVFLILNPITPPFVRETLLCSIFDGKPALRWIPRYLTPAMLGLGIGRMPHRR